MLASRPRKPSKKGQIMAHEKVNLEFKNGAIYTVA
jgi:hypothetical protein